MSASQEQSGDAITMTGSHPPSPTFTVTYCPEAHRDVLPETWISLFGIIIPIVCRLALPNQAQWFVDLVLHETKWCIGRGWSWFAKYAGFKCGDELEFAYQFDGTFLVKRLNICTPFTFVGYEVAGPDLMTDFG
ncbi:hypothetical protein AAHA92_06747 [Salvia divinorum]|uniref:TF-B3 domain-containing protein n=2 Tax=Salvia divinorum TaxID=28513 RepID=A0ABD1IA78_SALDI